MIEIFGKKYFTRNEIANSLHVTPETVSQWRRTGKLEGFAINKRKYIFSEKEIEKFILNKGDRL